MTYNRSMIALFFIAAMFWYARERPVWIGEETARRIAAQFIRIAPEASQVGESRHRV